MIKIKKLKQITETEKRTDIILDNPKFKQWFNGSKVVDSNGRPLVCFHGTIVNFSNFKTLSHFGTIDASNVFTSSNPHHFEFRPNRKDNIIPVYLSIKNPLKIKDEANDADLLGFDLYNQKLISWEEFLETYPTFYKVIDAVTNREYNKKSLKYIQNNIQEFAEYKGNKKFNKSKLISIFKNKGYDGFVYKNKAEDKGSISWIIFDANQVWPIFQNKPDKKSKGI